MSFKYGTKFEKRGARVSEKMSANIYQNIVDFFQHLFSISRIDIYHFNNKQQ